MNKFILGFVTAAVLTVGVAGAWVPYTQLTSNGFSTQDLETIIYEAVSKALRDNRR